MTTWQNPLRDERDKRLPRIAGPCGLVIFGVTGDLARKKLMRMLIHLSFMLTSRAVGPKLPIAYLIHDCFSED